MSSSTKWYSSVTRYQWLVLFVASPLVWVLAYAGLLSPSAEMTLWPVLDIIAKVRETTTLPVAAYQVSGEYLMLKSAAAGG